MTAYIDTNVLIDIEYGNYSLGAFRKVDVEYFFSKQRAEQYIFLCLTC